MDMIFLMTTKTENSIQDCLQLPAHIFMYQYRLLEDKLKRLQKTVGDIKNPIAAAIFQQGLL